MKKENKIYCKDCEHYSHWDIFPNLHFCGTKEIKRKICHTEETFSEKSKSFEEVLHADKLNRNNDCKYFEKKHGEIREIIDVCPFLFVFVLILIIFSLVISISS